MAIYDLGTASLAANGEVTGVGTTWKAPLTLIRVGATIVFKTEPVQIYTISEIISDTQVNVYNPNGESVPSGTGYAILAHDGITVQGLAQDVAETLRYYQSRETEIADAVDVFNSFDFSGFESKVTQVNTQHGDVVSIGAQVSNDAAQVSADKDAASSSALAAESSKNSAANSAQEAANSAQEAADSAASLNTENLVKKSDLKSTDSDSLFGSVNYTTIRNYTGTANKIRCTGRVSDSDGGEGIFYRLSSTTLEDDGGTVLVSTDGARWKREYDGMKMASWFGVSEGVEVSGRLQDSLRSGGSVLIKDGQYTANTMVNIDHSSNDFPVLGRKSKRFDMIGSSFANTVFNTNGNEFLRYQGNNYSVAPGQGVHSGAKISNFTVFGTGNTGIGMRLDGISYAKIEDLGFFRQNIGIRCNGVLSSDFVRLNCQLNNHGMYITTGSNSTFNAVRISGLFGANSKFGIEAEAGTNVYIEDSNFEGNGTDGDAGSGAIFLRITEPLSTINISAYFEANVGGADLIIDNTRSSPCVVNLKGCVFNRGGGAGGGNAGKGCTYNIDCRSSGGGIIILNLDGCVFFTQTDSGYVPSASRPYIKPAPFLIVNGESTCYFSESTSRAYTGSREQVLGLSVNGTSGVSANKPGYITTTRLSTGVYTIDSSIPFATNVDAYQVVANTELSGTRVGYCQKVSTTSIRVVVFNNNNEVTDANLNIMITGPRL